ncbi:NEDD4-binding protein 2 isoform X2 [Sceloporus undulatus]|uniref:NEDD4-binding protein 2 isoform X2 n=1 Tax=Sceloporus undulatus TaxID=8520 RepID=UPI001C4AF883|nr:NEDD4-binding protein 2 isoform X2 [Sceloporus undulatus]XP_042324053.1 NEDD4-binding protein 2 isoform X2 [Sceloporus undulatus]XP_042324054.1 NEDD4-binding protein 2 isoform X2 [Sceloporus undulatus]XP_042324055.1 NEDD4-binding protein 2 isoform X2 [Sceloporus undulatus]XP_042324057.1 NEDD4-binding protein 2 isoform X2 [Sceloporus undulatus]
MKKNPDWLLRRRYKQVEDTMDYLLELSTAAKEITSEVSGFDSISTSLVGENQLCSETEGQSSTAIKTVSSSKESEKSLSSEELFYLLHDSLEEHNVDSEMKDSENNHISGNLSLAFYYNSSDCVKESSQNAESISGYNATLSSQQMETDSEKLESTFALLNPDYYKSSELICRKPSVQTKDGPLDETDIFAPVPERYSLPAVVLDSGAVPEDITLANMEVSDTDPSQTHNVFLDLTTVNGTPTQQCQGLGECETGTSDSFNSQSTENQEHANATYHSPKNAAVPDLCAGSSLTLTPFTNVDPSQQPWNSEFSVIQKHSWEPIFYPSFYPQTTSHSFVTPVAISPGKWRPASDFRSLRKICSSQAFPQSWGSSYVPEVLENKDGSQKMNFSQRHQLPGCHSARRKTIFAGHVLVLLRGVPGSGKSYLARALLEDNPDGIILSTDDYFYQKNGEYQFDVDCLAEAHEWNRKRAKEAFEKRITPIIIDNTNTQAWEMKPYVALSQQHKYKVIFREPDTWWKFKPKELERRNIHGVSKEKIKKMLERYERCLTVNSILNSSIPDELKSATCDEVLHQKKEQGKENICSYGRNEEPFFSLLKYVDDNYLSEKVAVENQNLEKEKYDFGYNLHECNSEYRVPQDDLDVCTSPRKDKMDSVFETELIKTDIPKGKEISDFCVNENIQEYSNNDLKAQVEMNQSTEVLIETKSGEKQTMDGGDLTLNKSVRPEVFNFVGDWPIEQTMGQRVKRARKLEKLTKNHKEDKDANLPTFDSLKIPSEGEKLDLIDASKEMVLSVNKEHDSHQISASMSNVYTEKDTSGLVVVGDWPVQNSLEQRQHKLKRIPKKILSESEEIGSSQCDNSINIQSAVADLSGTSASTDKKESVHASNSSDTVHDKKPVQNKKIRKHHKLALTFTNNLAHSKPEEQLTLFNVLEEKPDECIMTETNKHSQTEPQDFALLWRLERKIIVSQDTKVLHGRLDGFIPKDVDATCPEKIPYKVTYEKSTYVEESELVSVDESENLDILCKLFGSFSFDALKDLYERCNRDIDWTTGILLDSDEKLCKDDNIGCLQKGEAQFSAMSQSKENTGGEGNVADFEETKQETVSVSSRYITDSEIIANSVDNGHLKTSDAFKKNAEISNMLADMLLTPSEINKGSDQALPEESKEDTSVLDCMKTHAKEMYSVILSENAHQNIPLHTEKDVCVPVVVPDDFNGDFSTLKPTFDMVTGNSSSEECQECSVVKDTDVQELLSDLMQTENLENNGGRLEEHKEMDSKPLFSKQAENKQNKKHTQGDDITKILNPTPASNPVSIDCLELTLPPELAIQLSEIFGPVGVDSGSLTSEDYVVHIDLNLAREIHEKWKASIMKSQKREEELNKLLEENPMLFEHLHLDELDSVLSQHTNSQGKNTEKPLIDELAGNAAASDIFPFMDHWNVQTQKVSLREIMSEEIALQEKHELKCFPFMARKDCAARLKEKQLLEIFPTINPNFLMDMFKDNNYSLEQTVQFLNAVLEADPVKTVVAKETAQGAILSSNSALKKKVKKNKEPEDILSENVFQDFEYPGYDDFRAEAFLHQQRRQESLRKAGEAYRMGMKPVAAFYVQQGRLHEQKMKEANHAAALQIFEKVNALKLPENLLDLHGLHVDEALHHLDRVLQEKTKEYNLAGGKPYLYVITGRGNHSQGGVARIKPAVMKYLTNHKFSFAEIKPGCLKVMLK